MKKSLLATALLLLVSESGANNPIHFEVVVEWPDVNLNVPVELCLEGTCTKIHYLSEGGINAAEAVINGVSFIGWVKPCSGWYECADKFGNAARALKRQVSIQFPHIEYGRILNEANPVKVKHFYYQSRTQVLYDKVY